MKKVQQRLLRLYSKSGNNIDNTHLPQLVILVLQSVKFVQMGVLWDTVKIFPHTPKHGTDGRFITLPILRSTFIIN